MLSKHASRTLSRLSDELRGGLGEALSAQKLALNERIGAVHAQVDQEAQRRQADLEALKEELCSITERLHEDHVREVQRLEAWLAQFASPLASLVVRRRCFATVHRAALQRCPEQDCRAIQEAGREWQGIDVSTSQCDPM